MTPTQTWDAVVVAGGSARRMGGGDKLMLDVGGSPMLHRAVAAAADAHHVVVVGPQRPLPTEVTWCREDPPGGGPAAAVAAGLVHVDTAVVVLLAGDLPLIDRAAVQAMAAAARGGAGVVAVDAGGQPQWLCSAWPTSTLRGAALAADASLRQTLGRLRWRPVTLDDSQILDCDTPADVERARELAP